MVTMTSITVHPRSRSILYEFRKKHTTKDYRAVVVLPIQTEENHHTVVSVVYRLISQVPAVIFIIWQSKKSINDRVIAAWPLICIQAMNAEAI